MAAQAKDIGLATGLDNGFVGSLVGGCHDGLSDEHGPASALHAPHTPSRRRPIAQKKEAQLRLLGSRLSESLQQDIDAVPPLPRSRRHQDESTPPAQGPPDGGRPPRTEL